MIRAMVATAFLFVTLGYGAAAAESANASANESGLETGIFNWETAAPVALPQSRPGAENYSIKDPSIVRYKDRWHLFCTIRGKERSHCVEYLTFADWKDAKSAKRHVLKLHAGYYCAPQVFYFTPHKKWYMLCQAADDSWEPKYQPAFSTSADVTDPEAWSPLTPLFGYKPEGVTGWLDFWVICDDAKAHLFYTSLDGRMWRAETKLADFPKGWSNPTLALRGDVFEASHTYRLKGAGQYLTIIEAQGGHGWRYQKAYIADRLDGEWKPVAAEKDKCFASMKSVKQTGERWTDSISHGELLRAGCDEKLEVDPANLRFLFQGVLNRDRGGKKYGEIPWSLGLLEPRPGLD